jgi:hypothetical protein
MRNMRGRRQQNCTRVHSSNRTDTEQLSSTPSGHHCPTFIIFLVFTVFSSKSTSRTRTCSLKILIFVPTTNYSRGKFNILCIVAQDLVQRHISSDYTPSPASNYGGIIYETYYGVYKSFLIIVFMSVNRIHYLHYHLSITIVQFFNMLA